MIVKFKVPRCIDGVNYPVGEHAVDDKYRKHWYFLACLTNGDFLILKDVEEKKTPVSSKKSSKASQDSDTAEKKGQDVVNADFRSSFPEFSDTSAYPDSQLDFWSSIAENQLISTVWGNIWAKAVMLYVAHEITLSAQNKVSATIGGPPGQSGGVAASKTVGSVSVSYDQNTTREKDAGFWNLTNYGTQLFRLMKLYGAGCIQL